MPAPNISPETLTDEALMQLAGKGNEQAFSTLYQRYAGRLYTFIRNMLGQDGEKAKDMLQDIFLVLIESPEKFDPTRKFSSWIYAVAANRCRNELRNRNNREHILKQLAPDAEPQVFMKYAGQDMQRFREQLQACMETLGEDAKLLFLLRFQQELPVKDIARIMDLPEGTVKSRLFYLVKLLAQKLRVYHPLK